MLNLRQGARLALVFDKERHDTIGYYFERAARNLGISYAHYWTRDSGGIDGDFDLYLRIDHGDYKYDLPPKLRPSAFYAVDTHLKKPYSKIRRQVGHYDYVFCAQKEGAQRLGREAAVKTMWVPIGCDPEVHKELSLEKKFDVAFVGTQGKKNPRAKLLNMLARKYPRSFIGTADFRLMSNIYSSALAGFNYSINNDINMRMFEILSCGALLVTNRIRDNGFEELFSDGVDVVVYERPSELLELMDHYLSHAEERQRIARQGHTSVLERHTYTHRLKTMLEAMGWNLSAT